MYRTQWHHTVLDARNEEKGYKKTWSKACTHVINKVLCLGKYPTREQKGGKTGIM